MQFGFTPDEIEVSERCVSRDNFPALKLWCWRCSEENTKRTYGTYRTPVSFEQEASVLKGDAFIEIRRTEKLVRGSCWFTGAVRGFPHPSTLQLRKQALRRGLPQTGDCLHQSLFPSIPQQNAGKEKKRHLIAQEVEEWQRITGSWSACYITDIRLHSCLLTALHLFAFMSIS